MDSFYLALSLFRKRQYDKCVEICSRLLEKQPLDQAVWCLKMRAMTQRVYVDSLENDEVITGDFLDNNVLASAPRPGTSMKLNVSQTAKVTTSIRHSSRPQTSTGRPISGIIRPGTQSGTPGSSALDRLKTTRPVTSQSARTIRVGTAAMLTQKNGRFIQISRLNIGKYAKTISVNKSLFEYLFYHENDVRNAMELAVQATQFCNFDDWWWKVQLAKCYISLNLIREAEQQLRSALKQQYNVETFIRLTRIYLRLDQPLSAIEICKSGLNIFPNDVSILTESARLYETINDLANSVKFYRNIVIEDAMNTEAIACIGMYHFYNNQPELALRYYRRVLAMGAHTTELYNNLGLCCLYSQQLDLTLACFQRALDLAVDPIIKADVWFNLAHVAIAAGDIELAMQCLNLCLTFDSKHASAFNNLAILHHKLGRTNLAKAYFTSSKGLEPNSVEPQINLELLQNTM